MFDGIGWAAGEVVGFMIISLFLGFSIGWFLGRWLQKSHIADEFTAQLAAERERAQKVEARLNERSRDLDAARVAFEGGRGRSGDLTDQIAALQTELESARNALVAAEVAPGVAPTRDEGRTRISEIAARTAGGVPPTDDDLTKVRGIGPKIEGLLKSMGITSFRQIARFETDDIAYVTVALEAFPGRIERDDWMSSAAEQHVAEYGEPV